MKTPKVIKDLTIQNYESIEDDKALIIGQKWIFIQDCTMLPDEL